MLISSYLNLAFQTIQKINEPACGYWFLFVSKSTLFSHVGDFLGKTSTNQKIKCLAQGHNIVPLVRLEAATPQSQI